MANARSVLVPLRRAATAAAELDVLLSLGTHARLPNMTRPFFFSSGEGETTKTGIEVVAGRHPMLDRRLPGGAVPNDVTLGDVPTGSEVRWERRSSRGIS